MGTIDILGEAHEPTAIDQLKRVASEPCCVAAAGLPDLHPGPGIPIGAAFAFRDQVLPDLVGSDAGCGVTLVAFKKLKHRGDQLERRVREGTIAAVLPHTDPALLLERSWAYGPRGLLELDVPESLRALCERAVPGGSAAPMPRELEGFGTALGTIGGGNHFVELSTVTSCRQAPPWLKRGTPVVLAHSGSRGLGAALRQRWGGRPLEGSAQAAYLSELDGAVAVARTNRLLLCWQLLEAVGAARPAGLLGVLDVVHNTVVRQHNQQGPVWTHRKGAAPAEDGQLTVVLGSRGAPSFVMRGRGRQASLASVAHGAGRRFTRADARSRFKVEPRRSLVRTVLGSRVICDDKALLYEEHPKAYRDIFGVIEALEHAGAADVVAELSPLVTVKR